MYEILTSSFSTAFLVCIHSYSYLIDYFKAGKELKKIFQYREASFNRQLPA